MPLPAAALGALIGLGGQAIQGTANAISSKRQRKHQIDFFNRQNAYNHPLEQIKRLEEAGLNKNLIYGGSPSQAAGEAANISSPSKPEFGNPVKDLSSFIGVQQSQAQTDLLKMQRNAAFQQTILHAEKQAETKSKTDLNSQEFNQKQELFKHSLQAANLNVKNMEQEVLQNQLDTDFKDATQKERIKQIYYKTKQAEATLKGNNLGNTLRRLQTELLNMGLDRNSPWYLKIFGNIISKVDQKL